VERAGPDVTVLARVGGHPVAVRQGTVLATSFHPEVSGDDRLHALFLELVAQSDSPTGT
jgi:5'-phosphate synthase pdxT subunit